ncbi:hypothetical protein THAOC_09122, partial [Thalassiosira oceanica]
VGGSRGPAAVRDGVLGHERRRPDAPVVPAESHEVRRGRGGPDGEAGGVEAAGGLRCRRREAQEGGGGVARQAAQGLGGHERPEEPRTRPGRIPRGIPRRTRRTPRHVRLDRGAPPRTMREGHLVHDKRTPGAGREPRRRQGRRAVDEGGRGDRRRGGEGDEPQRRGAVRRAREVRDRLHQIRRGGEARPRHRPGRRDTQGHTDTVAPDEEQPGPHRGSGSGQDGDRGGHRAEDDHGGRAGHAEAALQAHRARYGEGEGFSFDWAIGVDLGALVAGATMRGEFEERLKSVIDEVQRSDGEIVLFIDEMHTVVGAGATSGSMDASNLLKPALARGQLRCVGATTINEYRKYIEKDKALERRFQQVYIGEPSPEDAVSILRGLKPRYELYHGVRIRDEALLAAAKLSSRYLPDRFLPDKAIDLVDEACARLKNEMTSKPQVLDEVDRKIIQLEMERLSIKSDVEQNNLDADVKRLQLLESTLLELYDEQADLTARWKAEREAVLGVNELQEKIAETQLEIEKAEREYDLNTAAELKYGTLPKLEEQLEAARTKEDEKAASAEEAGETMLRDEVVPDDIANVISVWTGVPVSKLMETERERVLTIADKLGERVVGQEDAIEIISDAIQRSRAGMNDPSKPIASMIFLGPT